MLRKSMPLFVAFAILILLSVISVRVGAVSVPFHELWESLVTKDGSFSFIVREYRLPRIAVAILAGFGLAVAGVILQSIIRNPLASPDVIGITKGAGFAATLVIFVFPGAP